MVSQPVGRRLRRKEPEACLPRVTGICIFTSYPVKLKCLERQEALAPENDKEGTMSTTFEHKTPVSSSSVLLPLSSSLSSTSSSSHPPAPCHYIITRLLHLHHHYPNPYLIIYQVLCVIPSEISPFSLIRAKPMKTCRTFSPTMTSVILLSYSDGDRKSCAFLFF